jgi:integrase
MYIRPHKDGHRVEVEKHGMRASHVARTKREATAWGIRKEAEFDALKGSKGRTFGWAREHYVQTVSQTKSDGAADWEERRLVAMAQFFGDDTMLARIDSERIGQWRDFRLKGDQDHKPVGGSTVQREANLLRHLFTLAVDEWRCLERNPFKGVRLPEHAPARYQVWTWPLIKRVLRARRAGKTLEVIHAFHIALNTGMRLSEILAARLEGRVAVLPKDKTTKAPVKVPLARHGARLLKRYAPFTVGPNEASTLFSELCGDLLIEDLTFHDSRASALTWLSRRMDVMTLARISRHKDLRILMDTYYRETAEQIAARL